MTEETISYERAHLADTLPRIRFESNIADEEAALAQANLETVIRTGNEEARPLAELRAAETKQNAVNLCAAIKRPYFTRIDFAETGHDAEKLYIGKHGVMDSSLLESIVFDWRAPVANLYYMGKMGHVSYEAPAGIIEGELSLKRQFEIEDSELKNVFDTDIVSQDAYLQSALNRMSADRLQDIVTTIQSEQYDVIRRPLRENLIVQGAAGSGKTTIALHRVAYLLYSYTGRIHAENILILAPNPLFLDYISGVLPDLGVENVRQSTYARFTAELFELPRSTRSASTDAVAAVKGQLSMLPLLEAFWKQYLRSFIPEKGVSFGPVSLFTAQEFEKFLLEDEAGLPLETRLSALTNQLEKRVRTAAAQIVSWFEKETARRSEVFRRQSLPKTQLKPRLDALKQSLEARVRETETLAKGFTAAFIKTLPSVGITEVYRAFWQYIAKSTRDSGLQACAQHTLKQTLPDDADLPLICLLLMKTQPLKRPPLRHIVIDEAQDMSPVQLRLLRMCAQDATFTVVGDLMQNISVSGGTGSWQELTGGVFEGKCSMVYLTTSYRSTKQIMGEAFRLRARLGETSPITVIRDGNEVMHAVFVSPVKQAEIIDSQISAWKSAGLSSIAIITRSSAEANALSKLLPDIRLLDTSAGSYHSSVCIASAADSKGLEFDACIIADTETYGHGPSETKLLYVAMTRALHEMLVLTAKPDSAM